MLTAGSDTATGNDFPTVTATSQPGYPASVDDTDNSRSVPATHHVSGDTVTNDPLVTSHVLTTSHVIVGVTHARDKTDRTSQETTVTESVTRGEERETHRELYTKTKDMSTYLSPYMSSDSGQETGPAGQEEDTTGVLTVTTAHTGRSRFTQVIESSVGEEITELASHTLLGGDMSSTPQAVTSGTSLGELLTSRQTSHVTTAGYNVSGDKGSEMMTVSDGNGSVTGDSVSAIHNVTTLIRDVFTANTTPPGLTSTPPSPVDNLTDHPTTSPSVETLLTSPTRVNSTYYDVTTTLNTVSESVKTTTRHFVNVRLTTASFNQSLYQGDVIVLTSGQRAGLVAGVILLALFTILATAFGIYVRHRRLAYWQPDLEDMASSDRDKLVRHSQHHTVPSILWDPDTGPLDSLWQDNVIVEARGARGKKGKRIRNHAKLGYLNPIMEMRESEEDREDPNHNDYRPLRKGGHGKHGGWQNGISYITTSTSEEGVRSPVNISTLGDELSSYSSQDDFTSDDDNEMDEQQTGPRVNSHISEDNLSFGFDLEMSLDMSQIIDEQFAKQKMERSDDSDVKSHVVFSGKDEEGERESNSSCVLAGEHVYGETGGPEHVYNDPSESDTQRRAPATESDIVNISFDCLNSTLDFSGDWTDDIQSDRACEPTGTGGDCPSVTDSHGQAGYQLISQPEHSADNQDITPNGHKDKAAVDHIKTAPDNAGKINEESSGVTRYDRPLNQLEKINCVSSELGGCEASGEAEHTVREMADHTPIDVDSPPHALETPPSPFKAIGSIDCGDDELVNL